MSLHLKGCELENLSKAIAWTLHPGAAPADPDECRLCNLSRNTVRDMLTEPRDSDNFLLALHVRSNCRACRAAIEIPSR